MWGQLDSGHIDTGWAARLGKNGDGIYELVNNKCPL